MMIQHSQNAFPFQLKTTFVKQPFVFLSQPKNEDSEQPFEKPKDFKERFKNFWHKNFEKEQSNGYLYLYAGLVSFYLSLYLLERRREAKKITMNVG